MLNITIDKDLLQVMKSESKANKVLTIGENILSFDTKGKSLIKTMMEIKNDKITFSDTQSHIFNLIGGGVIKAEDKLHFDVKEVHAKENKVLKVHQYNVILSVDNPQRKKIKEMILYSVVVADGEPNPFAIVKEEEKKETKTK